jgi:hypothetical protein
MYETADSLACQLRLYVGIDPTSPDVRKLQ